jgi:hypothetical protein
LLLDNEVGDAVATLIGLGRHVPGEPIDDGVATVDRLDLQRPGDGTAEAAVRSEARAENVEGPLVVRPPIAIGGLGDQQTVDNLG